MLAKNWKRIGLIILIIACTFNIISKLVYKVSLNTELILSATYMQNEQENENKNK